MSPFLLLVVAAVQSTIQLVFSLSSVAGITAVISATVWLESCKEHPRRLLLVGSETAVLSERSFGEEEEAG